MRKKNLLFLMATVVLLSLAPACQLLECERNNTGTFYIENQSQSGRAYKILIDGINYGIVGAGNTKEWDIAAGPHVVQILFADTGATACSTSVPTVIKCKKTGLSCTA
ncbi:MAG: hypothetical protein FJY81_05080 [Candidatus Aminicenantes bacterium]|nr:hypothetical protein [Candidatus Aminicenantes bacterium]